MIKIQFVLAIIIILSTCAIPNAPTGGEKDIAAPAIKNSSVKNNSTNVQANNMSITFNENIQLNDAQNKIIINPPIKTEISGSNKSINIKFLENLKPNTTYSVSLNDAIKDYTEGNIGSYSPITFSTGNTIDSNKISLQSNPVNYFEKDVQLQSILINKSINYKNLFIKNNCLFSGLKKETFNAWVYEDKNKNNLIDSNEKIGVLKEIESREKKDTIFYNVPVFIPTNKIIYCNYFKNYCAFFNIPKPLIDAKNLITNYIKINDTFFIPNKDTLGFFKQIKNYFIKKSSEKNKLNYLTYYAKTINNTDSLETFVYFNQAIKKINNYKIYYSPKKDSVINLSYKIENNYIKISHLKSQKIFEIFIDSSIISAEDLSNKKIKILVQSNMNKLLEIKNQKEKNIILVLQLNNNTQEIAINSNETKKISLPLGSYSAYYYYDENENYLFDTPNFNTNFFGETYEILKNKILVTEKLENTLIIK